MFRYRIVLPDVRLNGIPGRLREFTLMKDIQKFFCLVRVEIQSIITNKLEGVPGGRIVTGSNSDSTIGLEPIDCQLHARGRANPRSMTSQPLARRPAATAERIIPPDGRVSRQIKIRPPSRYVANACAK